MLGSILVLALIILYWKQGLLITTASVIIITIIRHLLE